jgi:hypothetical protein
MGIVGATLRLELTLLCQDGFFSPLFVVVGICVCVYVCVCITANYNKQYVQYDYYHEVPGVWSASLCWRHQSLEFMCA